MAITSDTSTEGEIGAITPEQLREVTDRWARGESPWQIAHEMKLPPASIYKALKEFQKAEIQKELAKEIGI